MHTRKLPRIMVRWLVSSVSALPVYLLFRTGGAAITMCRAVSGKYIQVVSVAKQGDQATGESVGFEFQTVEIDQV